MHLQHCQIDSLARFHRPLLFSFTLLVLQPAAAGKHQNEPNTKGSLSTSVRQHTFTLPSLCLSTSYIHPAWAWVFSLSPAFSNASPLSPSPHSKYRWEELLPSIWLIHCLEHRLPSYLTPRLHLSLPHQRNLRLSLRIGDPTQHPHGSDFISRQLLQSRPQEQSVGGEANYLRHRVWDTSVRPLEDIAHLGISSHHLIFPNVHLWISFVSTISCRNVHLCCLGNEAVVLFKAAIDKATKVLTNWLCFPQPLFQHTS